MNQLGGFPLLTLIVFLPLLGAAISLFLPSNRQETMHWLAFLIAATTFFISLFLYMGWVEDPMGVPQFMDGPWPWIAGLGIYYHLAVDGINLHLVLLVTLLIPMVVLTRWMQDTDPANTKANTFWTLLFQGGMLGALTAFDLVLFWVFWLIVLISSFFLIAENGARRQTAIRFAIGIAIAATAVGAVTIGLSAFSPNFDLAGLSLTSFPWPTQAWLFWGMAAALGITGGILPLHYPLAQVFHSLPSPYSVGKNKKKRQEPQPAQLLIYSLLANLGGYGLIRFCVYLFPLAAERFAPAMAIWGTIGTLYGALAALGQDTLYGTLAYWNIAHVGLTVIGISSLENVGVHGAVMHMLGRSLGTTVLVLLASAWKDQQQAPTSSRADRAALALGFLSLFGVPGLVGFIGQGTLVLGLVHWQISESTVLNGIWYGLLAMGLLLGMWALLRAWQRAWPSSGVSKLDRGTISPPTRQVAIALPILCLILVLGLYPSPALDAVGPTVHRLLGEIKLGITRDMAPPELLPMPIEIEPVPFTGAAER